MAFTDDLDGLLLVHGREHAETPGGVALEIEADGRGKENGEENTCCFGKFALDKGEGQRHGGRNKQYLDYRIVILFYVQTPHRRSLRWREYIRSVAKAALLNLR